MLSNHCDLVVCLHSLGLENFIGGAEDLQRTRYVEQLDVGKGKYFDAGKFVWHDPRDDWQSGQDWT
ncbi:hypothetical protein PPNSA23_40300 [Phyllobacterium phragmitis]|uniref:Uncharacterized protein n=1 Tax=Phyllobacterium phragmitis TaxID=2670329 RepID=A0ABQ0H5B6_9HYPH